MKTIGRFRFPFTIALLLALATLLVFAQVAGHEFLYYDDNEYVTENPPVQGGLSWRGLVWAFTTMHAGNWHPMTWLSHMLDVQIFGLSPGGHHLVSALSEALQLKPDYANAWSNLGAVYLALGRIPEATDALLEATRLTPDDPTAWFNFGSLHGKTGRFAEAIKAYREALRLKPDYAAAWNNLGAAYQSSGRIPEATNALRKAAQFRSDDYVAWYNLGVIYARTGQLTDAVEALNEGCRIKPDHVASLYRLGMVYSEMGRQREALDAADRLRGLDAEGAEDLLRRISPSGR